MLTERRRSLALLRARELSSFWLARLLHQAGHWLVLIALLVAAYSVATDAAQVAWVLGAALVPRLIVVGLFEAWVRALPPRTVPIAAFLEAAGAAVVALLLLTRVLPVEQVAIGGAAALGFLLSVSSETRPASLRTAVGLARVGIAAIVDAAVDRAGLVAGAIVAALLLVAVAPPLVMLFGAALLGLAAALAFARSRSRAQPPARRGPVAELDADTRHIARRSAHYMVAAFTTGALGSVLMIAALPRAASGFPSPVSPAVFAAMLLAAGGLGMLVGPLPVARLLLRIRAPLLLLATVALTAAAAAVVALIDSVAVALAAYFVFGIAAATQDSLRALAVRRLVPGPLFDRMSRLSRLALTVGQVYGAVGVVSQSPAQPFVVLLLLAIAQVLFIGLALVIGGLRSSLQAGGFSTLPVKSVAHKLSWATRPEATAADFSQHPDGRVQRLARWINRQVEMQRLAVTLPVSGRDYEIYRPDDHSRERLFEAGRADPEKQMPYWAKVWPSGVALADVVVERRTEVADNDVLELGAGLGVTACAVLEYGGRLVTADYSALPLAHCRLNTLVNTGRAPRATCFNWRHDAEVMAVLGQPGLRDGFPLIIAGDVLYEGRDAEPLLNVIERLLTEDGSLWLAEPVRRTAQRFLDSAATLGWDIDSRQVTAAWPDATNGPVNVHFLTRSAEPDRIAGDLGGWRI